jgi:flagellar motility protein MotE (MotC chaperone)
MVTVALMLAASAALRLGDGVGAAIASGPDHDTGEPEAGAAHGAPAPLDCPAPPLELVKELTLREDRLAVREAAVTEREAALELVDQAVTARLAALEAAEQSLAATIAAADGAAEDDIARLTAVYETMKPKDAAALFGAMAPEFAAGFLGRMRPDAAAAVMAGMDPEAAYAVSLLLAGRNATAPKE